MINARRQRGFSVRTYESYLNAIVSFSRFFRRLLEDADADDVAHYFEYLVRERNLSPSTCRLHWGALQFLYDQELGNQLENATRSL